MAPAFKGLSTLAAAATAAALLLLLPYCRLGRPRLSPKPGAKGLGSCCIGVRKGNRGFGMLRRFLEGGDGADAAAGCGGSSGVSSAGGA